MTKNKLEKKFSESLRADSDFWGMKLHNNMLAHQTTPADYIMTYVDLHCYTILIDNLLGSTIMVHLLK